jgi:hypothetical protein
MGPLKELGRLLVSQQGQWSIGSLGHQQHRQQRLWHAVCDHPMKLMCPAAAAAAAAGKSCLLHPIMAWWS